MTYGITEHAWQQQAIAWTNIDYCKVSNIRHTKSQNLNASGLIL